MHLLLTDRLACPRCGPAFGLILLAHHLDTRSVLEGVLGCPNCRDSFPIQSGFGDLRAPPRGELAAGLAGAPTVAVDSGGGRLVALLGLERGPGTVALVGGPARYAEAVATALDDVHVVAVDPDVRDWAERTEVSRLVASPGLPFFDAALRGVVVDGRLGGGMLAEAARVVAPGARVVVEPASANASEALRGRGLSILATDPETVVASRG